MPRERIDRPDCERAHHFQAGTCRDPGCGLHIIALRSDDRPICEIIIGRLALSDLLTLIHDEGLDL
jgi:hypothetical protein